MLMRLQCGDSPSPREKASVAGQATFLVVNQMDRSVPRAALQGNDDDEQHGQQRSSADHGRAHVWRRFVMGDLGSALGPLEPLILLRGPRSSRDGQGVSLGWWMRERIARGEREGEHSPRMAKSGSRIQHLRLVYSGKRIEFAVSNNSSSHPSSIHPNCVLYLSLCAGEDL